MHPSSGDPPRSPTRSESSPNPGVRGTSPTLLWRGASFAGLAALAVWAAWWAYSLDMLDLLGCELTWIRHPFFGADFTTQSDYAARLWARGSDPYSPRDHLFHYPPIVIRLFLWTPLFPHSTALRIWIVVLALLIVAGTLVAWRIRRQLPIEQFPLSIAVSSVLFSFPALLTLERANFDLITLAAMVLAFGLMARRQPGAELLAGCILAVGPWVKLYPGIMGLGLLALRRFRALAGFAITGVAIGLAAPTETLRSLEVLRIAVERVKNVSKIDPMGPWSHSLSVAWIKISQAASGTLLEKPIQSLPPDWAAGAFVLVLASWVCLRLYRERANELLLFPLLCWLNALGSCVGAIANDYSLMFLPLAVVAVCSLKDPIFVRLSLLLLLLWWQPIDLNIPGAALLIVKVLGLAAVGMSLVQRGRALSTSSQGFADAAAAEAPGAVPGTPPETEPTG